MSKIVKILIFTVSNSENDGVAYTAQTAWIVNASLKDNILFGRPFDKIRFAVKIININISFFKYNFLYQPVILFLCNVANEM